MDNDDSLDESQGSTRAIKGKRGIIWGNAETSALIKIWGEAEIKYALSSLERNYEIFEIISTELTKIGFNRSAEECWTKTKSLRKLYKQAVLHNTTSGSGCSKFIWFDKMAQFFRTDTSIHPLRTTESESAGDTGTKAMDGAGNVLLTLDLFKMNDVLFLGSSDVSGTDTQSTDAGEPTTSSCSTAASNEASNTDTSRRNDPSETTNYEATMDPARGLAMLRKRKQRASAAAHLDSTLSGFVNWVQRNTETNNMRRNALDEAEKWFQNEVITNLRVASRSLEKLTDYITSSSSDCSGTCSQKCASNELRSIQDSKRKVIGDSVKTGTDAHRYSSPVVVTDRDPDSGQSNVSENDTGSDLEGDCSQSLLDSESLLSSHAGTSEVTHSTPSAQQVKGRDLAALTSSAPESTRPTVSKAVSCIGKLSPSPYLVVKSEQEGKTADLLRTPVKQFRKKKKIFLHSKLDQLSIRIT